MYQEIARLGEQVLAGGEISKEEALCLLEAQGADVTFIFAYADKIRETFCGDRVDLCSIVNARSGRCSEDCAFCAQSLHYETGTAVYDLLDEEEIVARAHEAKASGAHRFDIVTSGLGVTENDPDFQRILKALGRIKAETGLELCACLGTLTREAARLLVEVGVTRYNHNLEAAPSFFSQIVTTHTLEERVETVRLAREAGMEVCCGGIIGLGETPAQRVELALALRELGVDSVPINVLDPREGTPLAGEQVLSPLEALKTMAIFRFVLPRQIIRYAGGRENALGDLQAVGLFAGVNGMLIGNYLTTTGRAASDDLAMVGKAGRLA